MNKKESERAHAKKRAHERYGLELTKGIRDDIRGKIKRSDGNFIRRTSRRVSIWEIEHDNNKYVVAYDTQRKEIVTFLTEDMK